MLQSEESKDPPSTPQLQVKSHCTLPAQQQTADRLFLYYHYYEEQNNYFSYRPVSSLISPTAVLRVFPEPPKTFLTTRMINYSVHCTVIKILEHYIVLYYFVFLLFLLYVKVPTYSWSTHTGVFISTD